MKALVGLVIVVVLLIGIGYLITKEQAKTDPGFMINFATGDEVDGICQLDVEISEPMAPTATNVDWKEWIRTHFDLRDKDGQTVRMRRSGSSSLVGTRRGVAPAFYVTAQVRAGETYTLDYFPDASDTKRYRHTFTVPRQGEYADLLFFKPVTPD